MSHSNSSLNCFMECQSKFKHNYILRTTPDKPPSPHLTFGSMAHEVLEKAGRLRDDAMDGVVSADEYYSIIPSEVLYPDLKEEFGITSWQRYFTPVIKKIAQYEEELVHELVGITNDSSHIYREIKLQITPEELKQEGVMSTEPLVGVIDLLLISKDHAIIIDYKFSSNKKTQADFDMNSQLILYAYFVKKHYGIPLRNIQYGYIDIPKVCFGEPTVLTNGTLSRSKSQNVSQEMYEKAVIAIHGKDHPEYNCKPGGYYYDCWCNLALNKPAYLQKQWLDMEAYEYILKDVFNTVNMIELMKEHKMPFLRKYSSYSCSSCEYLSSCKPWLGVGGDENGLTK